MSDAITPRSFATNQSIFAAFQGGSVEPKKGEPMHYLRMIIITLVAMAVAPAAVSADVVKVGVIGAFSGPFALYGKNFKIGIETYLAQHGQSVGNTAVEFIYRDLPEVNPAQAKAIAQELIVKDGVQYLAGVVFTPDALAIAPLLTEAKVVLIIFNAGGSIITTKSPYIVRTSFTLAQTSAPMGRAAGARGIRKVVTAVSDYAPGIDSEQAFKQSFEAAGGQVVETIRMPLKTTDYAAFTQRIKDSGADAVFSFLPGGPPAIAFAKSFIENGLKEKGIAFLTTGDLTEEPDLPSIGDGAIGFLSTYHYARSHDSPVNQSFLATAKHLAGAIDDVSFQAVGAYDGVHALYQMIAATAGKQDPEMAIAAVKGLAWESPRGPVKIDPISRHITQTIYLRVVEKDANGQLINREIASFAAQGDPGLAGK
jgi:branched-chain amino acid transport system substrate-binding protein